MLRPRPASQLDRSPQLIYFSHQQLPLPMNSFRKARERRTRRLHRVDWAAFQADLSTACELTDIAEIDTAAKHLVGGILSVLDQHAPLVTRRKTERRPCPWITDELVACVRDRNRAHRLLMQDRTNDELRQAHRTARAAARKLDRKLKNLYFLHQCDTSDQRQLWSVMNELTGRKKRSQDPQIPPQDLSASFGEIVHDPMRPATLSVPTGPSNKNGFTSFVPVSQSDVEKCLQAIDPTKATGNDQIPGIVLRNCAKAIAIPLTMLVNESLCTGKVPLCFKVSHYWSSLSRNS